MSKHTKLFLFLLLSCSLNQSIQAQGLLDSLAFTWSGITDDSLRLAKQKEVALVLYREYKGEVGKPLALAMLEESRALGYAGIEKTSLLLLTLFSQDLGEIEDFDKYWKATYEISTAQRDTSSMLDLLNAKGTQFVQELKYDSAVIVFHQGLDLSRAKGDLARLHSIQNNLAIVFAEQGLLGKAKDHFERAAEASLLIGDSVMVFTAYLNVARCFVENDQLDSVATYIELANNWKHDAIPKGVLASYDEMLGRLAKAQGDYPAALAYLEQALAESVSNSDKVRQLAEIGAVQFELKDYKATIATLEQAETISLALGDNVVLRDILPILAQSQAALGNHQLAYEYGQRAIKLRDDLLDEEVQHQVAEMQAKFELKELNEDNEILATLAKTQQEKVRQRTNFALLASFLGVLIAALLFLVWRKNKRIRGFNHKLEKEVKARTGELEYSNQELQRYLEDMKMFTHVTSHDLKEPLRNISGFSSLLERRIKGQTQDEDTNTFLQMIRSNANQMHRLVESIQLYTQFEKEAEEEKFLEEINLATAIETVKNTLSSSIEEKSAQVNYSAELPEIYTSASVLQVVLKNLIENGIKYNRSTPPTVEIGYELVNNYHCIAVTDNGIGIETDFQDQVFEMFKRLHTQQEFKGTGMGLAISRKLALRFGGDILLQSKAGEGSTFVLKLPVR